MEYEPITPFESVTEEPDKAPEKLSKRKKRLGFLRLLSRHQAEQDESQTDTVEESTESKESKKLKRSRSEQADSDEQVAADLDETISELAEELDNIEPQHQDTRGSLPIQRYPDTVSTAPKITDRLPYRAATPSPSSGPAPVPRGSAVVSAAPGVLTTPLSPPLPRPPSPPYGGGLGPPAQPPFGPREPEITPQPADVAPNVLAKPTISRERAEWLGGFVVGAALGAIFEHFHHKHHEKRQAKARQKVERTHQHEEAELHTELDQQHHDINQLKTRLTALDSQVSSENTPTTTSPPSHEALPRVNQPAQEFAPSASRQEQGSNFYPPAMEVIEERSRVEQRDTTPEALPEASNYQAARNATNYLTTTFDRQNEVITPHQHLVDTRPSMLKARDTSAQSTTSKQPLIITSTIASLVAIGFLVWLLIR